MLKIITPKKQKLHKSTINSFLDLLSIHQSFAFSLERRKKATFIIAEDSQWGIYGGAVLFPREIFDRDKGLPPKGHEELIPQLQGVWIARVCFCLEVNLTSIGFRELELCRTFYDEIYEALCTVGRSKGVKFLAFGFEKDWVPQSSFKGGCHA